MQKRMISEQRCILSDDGGISGGGKESLEAAGESTEGEGKGEQGRGLQTLDSHESQDEHGACVVAEGEKILSFFQGDPSGAGEIGSCFTPHWVTTEKAGEHNIGSIIRDAK